ncbi:Rho termination factor [Nostoc sp. UIC 10607]|uniref:Rho termination factor n=1 Tax=Nostoc sp. UIC 10607 TaxID=3045935 RepID=UPI0039A0BC93
MKIDDIGNLMYLYRKEISLCGGTDAPEFLIKSTAQALNSLGGRNWIPVIVKEIGEDQYEVIGNSFIYAVAEEAGLDKVWCIIADDSKETSEVTKILAGEIRPKINLCHATRDEIKSALEYLIEKPGSVIKSVSILVAVNRIEEASDRKYWKTFEPITKLGCGITKGAKLNALKEVFALTPEPKVTDTIEKEVFEPPSKLPTGDELSPKTPSKEYLIKLTVAKLKEMARERKIPGYGRKLKDELVRLLSQ